MAQRMHIPEFGDWQGAEDAPYSAYFENASKKGKYQPQHKPAFPTEAKSGSRKVDSSLLARRHHKEADVVPSINGSETYQKGSDQDSPDNRRGGRGRTAGVRPRRVEESARDRFGRPRAAGKPGGSSGKGGGLSSHERKSLSDVRSQGDGIPSKTRKSWLRSVTQNNERSDAPVPQFGKWDENNPSSAELYSEIFEKVREERLGGGGKVPPPPEAETVNDNIHKQDNIANSKSCFCFPWSRK